MRRFDTFGEYMFDLLFAPLKKGKRAVNQFFIFFKVVGRLFDDAKQDIFRVRAESNIATASPVMLPVHGQDRDMPRLEGEDIEAYRTRLSMKGIIAEWGGTKTGILYALTALGYDQSEIERFSLQDPERWAEFIVYLKGSKQSGVNNLSIIDAEVRKVKEGSSKPAYGSQAGGGIEILSELKTGLSWYPRCGEIVCGVWPYRTSIGHLLKSGVEVADTEAVAAWDFPKVGTVAASEEFYTPYAFADYQGLDSEIAAFTRDESGLRRYPMCSTTLRCSDPKRTEGGKN